MFKFALKNCPPTLLDYFLHDDLHLCICSDDLGTASSFGTLEVLWDAEDSGVLGCVTEWVVPNVLKPPWLFKMLRTTHPAKQHCTPEDMNPQQQQCENLRSCKIYFWLHYDCSVVHLCIVQEFSCRSFTASLCFSLLKAVSSVEVGVTVCHISIHGQKCSHISQISIRI
jgi:hypothetical protein